jgi:putative mRNA 3-end processing factor
VNTQPALIISTPKGLYCQQADIYLDPLAPVERAIITHAHSDHARPGSSNYLTHRTAVPILAHRLGIQTQEIEGVEYGEARTVNGVRFSLHPAGHVIGSAQILIERLSSGERWVFSGDYKLEDDSISTPFEALQCDTFISECTFGLPVFRWQPQEVIFNGLVNWWRDNHTRGVSSVVFAYSLGKAQRILKAAKEAAISPIALHPAVWRSCELLGVSLDCCELIDAQAKINSAASASASVNQTRLIIAPPSALGSPWLRRFGVEVAGCGGYGVSGENQDRYRAPGGANQGFYTTANVSGWMAIRGIRKRSGVGRGFILSDHADFYGLTAAVRATGASRVFLTHGYSAQFGRWLREELPRVEIGDL